MTRLSVLDALVSALEDKPFAEITVRSLCREVGISEPTFFKYFPRKEDVLVLFVHLWSIELSVRVDGERLGGRDVIALVFAETARQIKRAPRVMHEIIADQMRSEGPPTLAPPTRAELMMRFPDVPAAWEARPTPVQALIGRGLERAQARGEIAEDASVADATWTLVGLFFGVPASTRSAQQIGRRYRRALDLVWAGLGGEG